MTNNKYFFIITLAILYASCNTKNTTSNTASSVDKQPVFHDVVFSQDYSIKYYLPDDKVSLTQVACDRNGVIQMLSREGLMHLYAGQFLYPGTVVPDHTYRPMSDKNIHGMGLYQNQFVYVDDKAVLSNAWAGKIYEKHDLPNARILAGGHDFTFLISDGKSLELVNQEGIVWKGALENDGIINIKYDSSRDIFWILGSQSLSVFSPQNQNIASVFAGDHFTCFALVDSGKKILIGTDDGYLTIDTQSHKQIGPRHNKLPYTNLTVIEEINNKVWFGSAEGTFMLCDDGKFNYYYGERWIPGNFVRDIAAGDDGSVLVLTDKGLGKICFKSMTLQDKADYFEQEVRLRHIRNGFNSTLGHMQHGDLSTGTLEDSDNDGLWTSMYMGGEVFRYAATKSPEALQNCRESLDAMERLYTVNPVPGFPSRSFERSGYIEQLADPDRWQHSPDPEWDWKSTTSSDEIIGHIFAFGVIAELIDDQDLKSRAITLIDTLMSHILSHDLYLVDYNGKPTQWGRWNPDYVNSFPKMVGDRKLNSSNIIAMLQTAYHFTHKEKYKDKALELMTKYGYLENLMRPMKEIGEASDNASELGKTLSGGWNHSDDEMYFVGYWGLYRYALNDTLQEKYKEAILDHWQAERPEKEGAWDIFTAITGVKDFDLPAAIWYLQEYPLDLISWGVKNSQRKDIEMIAPNFREQTTKEVLPPDELRVARHNANRFTLDSGGNGSSENSAGDIWLLPYWMGRYLDVISAPEN